MSFKARPLGQLVIGAVLAATGTVAAVTANTGAVPPSPAPAAASIQDVAPVPPSPGSPARDGGATASDQSLPAGIRSLLDTGATAETTESDLQNPAMAMDSKELQKWLPSSVAEVLSQSSAVLTLPHDTKVQP